MTQAGHNHPPDDRLDTYDPPCPEESFAHPTAYEALVHAWDMLRLLVARVGSPFDLFLQTSMRQWQLFRALDLLRPLEQMLRGILFLEAQALAPSLPEPGPAKRRPSRPRSLANIDVERSETWRAPFHNFRSARPSRPGRPYQPHPQPDPALRIAPRDSAQWLSCWPLAQRIEAAIRICNDPLPWIRRLAFRIRRGRAPDLTRLPRPQRLHYPSAGPTLAALKEALDQLPSHDSS